MRNRRRGDDYTAVKVRVLGSASRHTGRNTDVRPSSKRWGRSLQRPDRLLRGEDEALQVLAFGERQQHGVVGGVAQLPDNTRVSARLQRRLRRDRAKQIAVDGAGAREREEEAAGIQEAQAA